MNLSKQTVLGGGGGAIELEMNVHPKVRNHGEGPIIRDGRFGQRPFSIVS